MQRDCDVVVRPSRESDDAAITGLRRALNPSEPKGPPSPPASGDPLRVLVAEIDDVVVGMITLGSRSVGPAFGVTALEVTEVHVRGGFEQCGVGAVLIAAATTEAERLGCDHLWLTVPPTGRDIGLVSPVRLAGGRRRLASVSTLRRRLGLEPTHRGSLLARRRAVLRGVEPLLPQPVVRRG